MSSTAKLQLSDVKSIDISAALDFLGCQTPQAWIQNALKNEAIMLV